MNYSCFQCKKPFIDGEFVGLDSNGGYHTIHDAFAGNSMPMDCLRKRMLTGEAEVISSQFTIYYQGKLHNLSDVPKLPNLSEIGVRLNVDRTGHMLIGNIEGLSNLPEIQLPAHV